MFDVALLYILFSEGLGKQFLHVASRYMQSMLIYMVINLTKPVQGNE